MSAENKARVQAIEAALLKRWPETRIAPSLDRIAHLVDLLGSPQLSYPTIHITGTNGKTSTTRMIDSLCFASGLRTGRFTSPHLEDFRERISINGLPISEEALIFSYNDIAPYLELCDEKFEHPVSFFEAITALAFAAFAEHPIDVGIIEVGMGGQWDATNVVNADVSVITPIGMDHMEYLGNSLTEIARTKAGILKAGGFAIFAEQDPEAAKELMLRAGELEMELAREGMEYSLSAREIAVGGQLISVDGLYGNYDDIFLPLHGKHQAHNAATALVAVEAFFGKEGLDVEQVREGFAHVSSPGRCEILHRDPTVIVDAAHNPHGAAALAHTITHEFTFDDIIGVVSIFADKDAENILRLLEPIMNSIIVTQNSSPRAMAVAELEKLATSIFGADRVFARANLIDAINLAIDDAKRPLSDETVGIVITGSVITVGEARTLVRRKFSKES